MVEGKTRKRNRVIDSSKNDNTKMNSEMLNSFFNDEVKPFIMECFEKHRKVIRSDFEDIVKNYLKQANDDNGQMRVVDEEDFSQDLKDFSDDDVISDDDDDDEDDEEPYEEDEET